MRWAGTDHQDNIPCISNESQRWVSEPRHLHVIGSTLHLSLTWSRDRIYTAHSCPCHGPYLTRRGRLSCWDCGISQKASQCPDWWIVTVECRPSLPGPGSVTGWEDVVKYNQSSHPSSHSQHLPTCSSYKLIQGQTVTYLTKLYQSMIYYVLVKQIIKQYRGVQFDRLQNCLFIVRLKRYVANR